MKSVLPNLNNFSKFSPLTAHNQHRNNTGPAEDSPLPKSGDDPIVHHHLTPVNLRKCETRPVSTVQMGSDRFIPDNAKDATPAAPHEDITDVNSLLANEPTDHPVDDDVEDMHTSGDFPDLNELIRTYLPSGSPLSFNEPENEDPMNYQCLITTDNNGCSVINNAKKLTTPEVKYKSPFKPDYPALPRTPPHKEAPVPENVIITTSEPTSTTNENRTHPITDKVRNFEFGRIKKKSETKGPFSIMECIINNNKTEVNMLNSLHKDTLDYCLPDYPAFYLGKEKVKNGRIAYYIHGCNNTKIKFGLFLNNDENNKLIIIKKYSHELPSPCNNNQPGELANWLKKGILGEANLQERAGSIAPRIYGLAINTTQQEVKGYIAMELCLGFPLSQYCYNEEADKPNLLRIADQFSIAIDISSKLAELHKNSIYHGDIKLNNIIRTSDSDIKIIDYGLSNDMQNPTEIELSPNEIRRYHAYEIYNAARLYQRTGRDNILTNPCKTDIYSLGVLLTHIFNPYPYMPQWLSLYKDSLPGAMNEKNADIVKSAKIPDPNVEALLLEMVDMDPEKRPDLKRVIFILRMVSQEQSII